MPPTLPDRRPRAALSTPPGPALPSLVAATLALVAAGEARALDLSLSPPRERAGYVYVDARVGDPFVPRVRESLGRGMPATVELRAELWRRRDGWFDRLESSFEAGVRIRYEVWTERFRIDRPGVEPFYVTTLDSVATLLDRPWSLPACRVGQLKPRVRYYVVVHAVLKPLTVEDIQEVEGWLSGEVENKRRAGFAVITELPRALFDAVRNFAGFGDRRTRATTPEFELRDLFPSPRGAF